MDSERIEAIAAQWLAKRVSDHWEPADQAQLDAWVDAATAHRLAYVRLYAAWRHAQRMTALGAGVPKGAIPSRQSWRFQMPFDGLAADSVAIAAAPAVAATPKGAAPMHGRTQGRRRLLATAAMLALAVGIGSYHLIVTPDTYHTDVGGVRTVSLPDGSTVMLNTDSRIDVAVDKHERRIVLERGEAYFDVAKDPNRPFSVVAGDRRVVAVGTRFSVRRDGSDVHVLVTDGRVRLERVAADASASVVPLAVGASAHSASAGISVKQRPLAEMEQALSWRNGYISFSDTALADAVKEFNRYSKRRIEISDPVIASIRIGGNFRVDNVEAFLWLLETGFPIDVERRGDRIALATRATP